MKKVYLLKCLSIAAVCSLFIQACRKEKVNYNHLSGVWPMMGQGCADGGPCVENAFIMIEILALDEHNIVVNNDTLPYQSSLSKNDTIVFKKDESQYYKLRYEELRYDKKQGVLMYDYQYNFSNAGASYKVSNYHYKPNPNIGNYVSKIVGTKLMSGVYYDTLYRRLPTEDSSATLNLTMTFSALNDSTIEFRETLLQNMPSVLHYMATDAATNSVIFQSEATLSKKYSVLTYNYTSNSFIFEQVVKGIYYSAYVKLQ